MTMRGDTIQESSPSGDKAETKAGMIGDVKNLYQSKPDNRGKTTWVQDYPDDLIAAAENSETAKYALLVRNKKCYNGRKSLEIDSLVVQSPLLKDRLGHVLKDYPGVTTNLDRLTFKAPFKEFVHRWKALVEALNEESDPETKSHLDILHRVLEVELRDDLKALDDYIQNGVITYDTIWMLFEPGELIFGSQQSQPAVGKLSQGSYQQTRCGNYYSLSCNMVDWDGENFGWDSTGFKVPAFLGTASITKLAAFPLNYHPKLEKVKAELVERGRAFEALGGSHYKQYSGIAIGQGPWGPIKYNVDSRIIIDTYAWNRFNPNRQISLNRITNKANDSGIEWTDDDYDSDEEDSYSEVSTPDGDCGLDSGNPDEIKPDTGLTDKELLMCNCVLRGYSLRNKKWLEFAIASVRDINFSTGAFDSLVLPQDHKELILALTESQAANKETFDDVIQGKGKGMIMLLSGPRASAKPSPPSPSLRT
ncbi:uncharacterized protein KY384_003917 [Bacidia gigantensis]|uniref:uncharacterized protein n=1 Tax=Bacidia gigantensis TaxID=2732470 RepID=UPI001D03ED6A|nr:uncharacterized protein KY384_003917 [Bacidia gigantensis]KAG8532276.1 hypothetical protein KY384_003917 [Bacidia gigantensis]